jgi:hypothetical protein
MPTNYRLTPVLAYLLAEFRRRSAGSKMIFEDNQDSSKAIIEQQP